MSDFSGDFLFIFFILNFSSVFNAPTHTQWTCESRKTTTVRDFLL